MVLVKGTFYARELGFAIKLLVIGEQLETGLALKVHPHSSAYPSIVGSVI